MYVAQDTAVARSSFAKDRQRIPTPWLYLVLAVGLLPFVLMGLRFLALAATGPAALIPAGEWLNQHLALQWVGFEDRDVVLYILLLPLAALLVALTRLTLGIRVLGFRSILIAIGMQEIGVLPCLLLILLIAGTVALVRPSMRRSGMPLYARVATVLCIVAFTMLGGLLAGAWIDSATLWSMAFFPVVILAMLAESVADTVARDGMAMAVWRTATTIVLAAVIAGLQQWTALGELVLSCPELLLTPLALIVLVSEFLDLRLFEDFRPFAKSATASEKPTIALVRNRFPESPPRRLGAELPKFYRKASLQNLIDQLRERGYTVEILECDCSLPMKLRALAAKAFGTGGKGLCVLNYSGGVQGSNRLTQVPTVCEMLGVPHTGPDTRAAALCSDRKAQLDCLRSAGLRVPVEIDYGDARRVLESGAPVWLRHRVQADRSAVRVSDLKSLKAGRRRFDERSEQLLIEPVPSGQPLTVSVLNPESLADVQVLPPLERRRSRRRFQCAAELDPDMYGAVTDCATRAARALGCRGTARVDLYCTASGEITVSRVFAVEPLTERSATGVAAAMSGLTLADIAEYSLQAAFGGNPDAEAPPPRDPAEADHSNGLNQQRSPAPCLISA